MDADDQTDCERVTEMRHTIEFNDALDCYVCIVCGQIFGRDALADEAHDAPCQGPKADEGTFLNDILGVIGDSGLKLTSIDVYTSDLSYTYSWRNPESTSETRPAPYEDCETKGRRLVKSAGYMNDDEGGEK
jgi:hypothetical protein